MIIRRATPDDYQALMALYADFMDKPELANLGNNSFDAVMGSKTNFVFVGEDDSKQLTGFITASIRHVVRYPQPIMQVDEFYVSPDFRKHGIGKQLMQEVEALARSNGCLRIYIESAFKDELLGHRFYLHHGYEKRGSYFLKLRST